MNITLLILIHCRSHTRISTSAGFDTDLRALQSLSQTIEHTTVQSLQIVTRGDGPITISENGLVRRGSFSGMGVVGSWNGFFEAVGLESG